MNRRTPYPSGMTLIELVAAVAIFALLVSLLMLAVNATLANWRNARTRVNLTTRGMTLLDIMETDLQEAETIWHGPDPDGNPWDELKLLKEDTAILYYIEDHALRRMVLTNVTAAAAGEATGEIFSTNVLASGVHDMVLTRVASEALDVGLTLFPPEMREQMRAAHASGAADVLAARNGVRVARRIHVPNQLAEGNEDGLYHEDNRLKLPERRVTLSGDFVGKNGRIIQPRETNVGGSYELAVPAFQPVTLLPEPDGGDTAEGSFSPAFHVWRPGSPTNHLDFVWVSTNALRGRVVRSDMPTPEGVGVAKVNVFDAENETRIGSVWMNSGHFSFNSSATQGRLDSMLGANPPLLLTLADSPNPNQTSGAVRDLSKEGNVYIITWEPPALTLRGRVHAQTAATVFFEFRPGPHQAPYGRWFRVNNPGFADSVNVGTPAGMDSSFGVDAADGNTFIHTVYPPAVSDDPDSYSYPYSVTSTLLFDWRGIVTAKRGVIGPGNEGTYLWPSPSLYRVPTSTGHGWLMRADQEDIDFFDFDPDPDPENPEPNDYFLVHGYTWIKTPPDLFNGNIHRMPISDIEVFLDHDPAFSPQLLTANPARSWDGLGYYFFVFRNNGALENATLKPVPSHANPERLVLPQNNTPLFPYAAWSAEIPQNYATNWMPRASGLAFVNRTVRQDFTLYPNNTPLVSVSGNLPLPLTHYPVMFLSWEGDAETNVVNTLDLESYRHVIDDSAFFVVGDTAYFSDATAYISTNHPLPARVEHSASPPVEYTWTGRWSVVYTDASAIHTNRVTSPWKGYVFPLTNAVTSIPPFLPPAFYPAGEMATNYQGLVENHVWTNAFWNVSSFSTYPQKPYFIPTLHGAVPVLPPSYIVDFGVDIHTTNSIDRLDFIHQEGE